MDCKPGAWTRTGPEREWIEVGGVRYYKAKSGWFVEDGSQAVSTPLGKTQPHRCPVCGGNGLVANGFYSSTSGRWSTTDATPETCRTCMGTGMVWSPQ